MSLWCPLRRRVWSGHRLFVLGVQWRYKVNLICLPLQELEVILGMDWLFVNRIIIDCREKRLLFPDSKEPELLSSQGVVKELQEGA